MAHKISFINLKGGVGKTSLIVNIGACLSYIGKRVLIVDLDAQSNSSIWLMRLDRWNALNRTPEKFILSLLTNPESSIESCIQKNPIRDAYNEELLKGLDVLPASFNLLDLEHDSENPWGKAYHFRFWEQIKKVESEYDYILYDCPPSFYYAPQCAIFASDSVIVPSNPDALSIVGFHLLVDKLTKFKEKTEEQRGEMGAPTPDVLGIILNAVKPGVNIDVPLERFNGLVERFIAQNRIQSKAHIFPTRIRHSVVVGRAVMQGVPTVLMSKSETSAKIAVDYIETAKHLDAAISPTISNSNES